jgi:hypothetical protein
MIGDSLTTGDKMSPGLTDRHHDSLTIARGPARRRAPR